MRDIEFRARCNSVNGNVAVFERLSLRAQLWRFSWVNEVGPKAFANHLNKPVRLNQGSRTFIYADSSNVVCHLVLNDACHESEQATEAVTRDKVGVGNSATQKIDFQ